MGSCVYISLKYSLPQERRMGKVRMTYPVVHDAKPAYGEDCASDLGLIRGNQDDHPYNINFINKYL